MVLIAYLFPIFAILILKTVFHFKGEWTVLLWIFLIGDAFIGLLHYVAFLYQTLQTEYLGSIVKSIHFEKSWIELIEITKKERDKQGNSYSVTTINEKYHPEKYYFFTSRDTKIKTDIIFYNYVLSKWEKEPASCSWTGKNIKGGIRYGESSYTSVNDDIVLFDNPKWVSVTEKNKYINPIKNSNSIFRYKTISKREAADLGLYDYPSINFHDAPCILYEKFRLFKILDEEIHEKFRRFNAVIAPKTQMRLYILIFDYLKGMEIALQQKIYWKGGNKNEFVICLGLTSKSEIRWTYVFSWADEQNLETETTQWFLKNKILDLGSFYNWFFHEHKKWERKEFADFSYLTVPLKLWQLISIYFLSILENIMALNIVLSK